jgi:ribosome-binding protein aMBF1 (putative translation factor)
MVRDDHGRLARALEQAIMAAGLSPAEAGRQAEISDATMRRYLAGDAMPDRHAAQRLATVLGVAASRLTGSTAGAS